MSINRRFVLSFGLLSALLSSLLSALVLAQPLPRGYVDPQPVLAAAERAIGAGQLDCVRISGTGYAGAVGQGKTQDLDWPRTELSQYTRTIDYRNKSSVEEFSRPPGRNPRSWKYGSGWLGGTPAQQHERQTFAVKDGAGWHVDGPAGAAVAAPPSDAELWQLDIWMNPHGFLKAARMPGADPKAVWRWELVESGRDGATTGEIEKVHVVSITVLGKYRVNATINSEHLIQRLETKYPHPVLGDMNFEHEFTEWKTVNGITFPAGWHSHQGYDDERYKPTLTGGHNAFGGTFADIRPNACGAPVAIPAAVRQAPVPVVRVESRKLADGVWLLGGSSHNSVAVEFEDYIAVIEAPLNEERSLAVIEEVVRLIPGKPIRWVVNTHDHFDHMGGLRTYLHIGATIVTHKRNRAFYEEELLNYVPRTLEPDMMTLYQPTEIREGYTMEAIAENYIISDFKRHLHISYVQPLAHVEGMLMAYLPAEKLAIQADLYNPPGAGGVLSAGDAAHRSFYDHVKRLKFDVETIVPIHGQPVPWAEFLKVVGEAR